MVVINFFFKKEKKLACQHVFIDSTISPTTASTDQTLLLLSPTNEENKSATYSPFETCLHRISLERQKENRPIDLSVMTLEQMLQERTFIKKELLQLKRYTESIGLNQASLFF